jgi:hypothetical protein
MTDTPPIPSDLRAWIFTTVLPAETPDTTDPVYTCQLDEDTPVRFERDGDAVVVEVPATDEAEGRLREAFGLSSEQIGKRSGGFAGFLFVRDTVRDGERRRTFRITRPGLINQVL